ncbi:MAG: hypothetical protein H6822_12740 [Planctomycetaceae bacterium]|nr:hypothetical protein [Planctomycetales bacterium]MCB9923044.1 hypothetical protein [Planctomycetaceae bacterium]
MISTSSLPKCELSPGMHLTAAFEHVAKTYEAAGFQVHRPIIQNSMPQNPLFGIAMTLTFHPHDENCVIVYPGVWTDEAVLAVLNYVNAFSGTGRQHYIVGREPTPEILDYLTSGSAGASFALMCLAKFHDRAGLTSVAMADIADAAQSLLRDEFSIEIDRSNESSLDVLDEFVLNTLRTEPDSSAHQHGYVPTSAMIGIGALAGEIMRACLVALPEIEINWILPDRPISRFGIALEVTRSVSKGLIFKAVQREQVAIINPLGKTVKLFESGVGDSLACMFRMTQNLVNR